MQGVCQRPSAAERSSATPVPPSRDGSRSNARQAPKRPRVRSSGNGRGPADSAPAGLGHRAVTLIAQVCLLGAGPVGCFARCRGHARDTGMRQRRPFRRDKTRHASVGQPDEVVDVAHASDKMSAWHAATDNPRSPGLASPGG